MKHMIFGESHGPAIGVTLEGLPSGLVLDMDQIKAEMARRAPGNSPMATARKEADQVEILSGLYDGKTTGTPLCAVIQNTDTRSKDYSRLDTIPRPSHGDYAGSVRYEGYQDYRGGGHFSGRLTAPLVFAGAVAKQILALQGISVSAVISKVEKVDYPTPEQMEEVVLAAKADGDSVGGCIACQVTGLKPGLGSPDFGSNVEGIFSQYLFAVPAVKGVSFGTGFGLAELRGSQANDHFYMKNGLVKTRTNHAGGVNGGITNGMPVTFEVVIRPTPSISKTQETIDLETGDSVQLSIHGRHDPCILPRAVVVIEAAAALATCTLLELQ